MAIERAGWLVSPNASDHSEVCAWLQARGCQPGALVAVAMADGVGVGVAMGDASYGLATHDPCGAVELIESQFSPRWVCWSVDAVAPVTRRGSHISKCWDIAAAHRLMFGGWKADPQRVWSKLHDLDPRSVPEMGQLDLLAVAVDEGTNPESAVRPDGHLRPEWVAGGWSSAVSRLQEWAVIAMRSCVLQRERFAEFGGDHVGRTARSESAAELLASELAVVGLPIDVTRAEAIISTYVGPRPKSIDDAVLARRERDAEVLVHAPLGGGRDLRNAADVRSMLRRLGVDVVDTRAWRLEPYRESQPFVDALLRWRKAERFETTFGYDWLDANVGADGRLRGAWTGSDGAAGRMTAQAGLHNMPVELRGAVVAERGHTFVRADLGQIEPRVLAAVSGDEALTAATQDHDMYAPVAARLAVDRATAKVAILAAMYGQTSGTAGQALAGMDAAYPVAMRYLRDADDAGRAGRDVRTYGGRLVRMWQSDGETDRSAVAARGRFARNALVQGAAAELFKVWAVTVRTRVRSSGARIVLCLHDEILLHVPSSAGDEVAAMVDDCLAEAAARWATNSRVRFVADTGVIANWSDAKP